MLGLVLGILAWDHALRQTLAAKVSVIARQEGEIDAQKALLRRANDEIHALRMRPAPVCPPAAAPKKTRRSAGHATPVFGRDSQFSAVGR